jgi:transcription-repair coupling factor (superfamily II helicase)
VHLRLSFYKKAGHSCARPRADRELLEEIVDRFGNYQSFLQTLIDAPPACVDCPAVMAWSRSTFPASLAITFKKDPPHRRHGYCELIQKNRYIKYGNDKSA